MVRLLLLYDTDDQDFARDVADLLGHLDIEVAMIPRAPDGGLTLQGKEEKFFDSVAGALFLVTPGSERHGKKYPSPSVADEMGRAKQRFMEEPWRVIYLVDSECNLQSVDQRGYIPFTKTDHRSVIQALGLLVESLKGAAILAARVPAPPETPPDVDVPALARSMPDKQKRLCLDLAAQPSGVMLYSTFVKAAGMAMRSQADGNIVVRDLIRTGLVTYQAPTVQGQLPVVFPTAIGWDLVRHERMQIRLADTAAQQKRRDAEWPYRYRMLLVGDDTAMRKFIYSLKRFAGGCRIVRPVFASGEESRFVDLLLKRRARPEDIEQAAKKAGFEEAGKVTAVR